jgi:hypothetical protein
VPSVEAQCLTDECEAQMTERWIGRWLMVVGALHVGYGLTKHATQWRDIAAAGFFDAVAGHAARGHAAWFLLCGPVLLLAGLVLDALEASRVRAPALAGIAALVLIVFGLVLMPRSGFWLAIPPAIALTLRAIRR